MRSVIGEAAEGEIRPRIRRTRKANRLVPGE